MSGAPLCIDRQLLPGCKGTARSIFLTSLLAFFCGFPDLCTLSLNLGIPTVEDGGDAASCGELRRAFETGMALASCSELKDVWGDISKLQTFLRSMRCVGTYSIKVFISNGPREFSHVDY